MKLNLGETKCRTTCECLVIEYDGCTGYTIYKCDTCGQRYRIDKWYIKDFAKNGGKFIEAKQVPNKSARWMAHGYVDTI